MSLLMTAASVVLCLAPISGEAAPDYKQKVIYPDGTVRYETVRTTQSTRSPTSETSICDLCGDSSPDCPGCKKGVNKPEILPSSGDCKDEKCEEIPVEIDGSLEEVTDEQKFYKKCIEVPGLAEIPVIVCRKVETLEFKTIEVTADKCCKYKVCVPCKKCVTCERKCELQRKKVDLKICLRESGGIDVYVLNQPGMPKEWLYLVDIGIDDARTATEATIQF